ncbi:MAG TPA: DUF5076 domain-containing protein [Gammaproteobacteria bacterium]
MSSQDQLIIPDSASNDSNSYEVLRVWIAHKGQHVSIRGGMWDDPAAWGILLADLARHIANSYQQDKRMDSGRALSRIKSGFDAEIESPTDKANSLP